MSSHIFEVSTNCFEGKHEDCIRNFGNYMTCVCDCHKIKRDNLCKAFTKLAKEII